MSHKLNKSFSFINLEERLDKYLFYSRSVGLISSKKYRRVAKKLAPVLKGVIPIKFSFYEILTKIQTKKGFNFLKT